MTRFYQNAMLYGTNRQALRALDYAGQCRSITGNQYAYLLRVAAQIGLQMDLPKVLRLH